MPAKSHVAENREIEPAHVFETLRSYLLRHPPALHGGRPEGVLGVGLVLRGLVHLRLGQVGTHDGARYLFTGQKVRSAAAEMLSCDGLRNRRENAEEAAARDAGGCGWGGITGGSVEDGVSDLHGLRRAVFHANPMQTDVVKFFSLFDFFTRFHQEGMLSMDVGAKEPFDRGNFLP